MKIAFHVFRCFIDEKWKHPSLEQQNVINLLFDHYFSSSRYIRKERTEFRACLTHFHASYMLQCMIQFETEHYVLYISINTSLIKSQKARNTWIQCICHHERHIYRILVHYKTVHPLLRATFAVAFHWGHPKALPSRALCCLGPVL